MSNKIFLIPGANQRKYQSSASLTFERGIHRWLVDPTQRASNAEMYLFDDVMMSLVMIDHFKGQLLFKPCNIVFFITKNDPTYNIHGDFMQIYILHFRNSGIGSMELENAFCCPIGDISWRLCESLSVNHPCGKNQCYGPIYKHCFSAWSWCMLYRSLLDYFHKSLKLWMHAAVF